MIGNAIGAVFRMLVLHFGPMKILLYLPLVSEKNVILVVGKKYIFNIKLSSLL